MINRRFDSWSIADPRGSIVLLVAVCLTPIIGCRQEAPIVVPTFTVGEEEGGNVEPTGPTPGGDDMLNR